MCKYYGVSQTLVNPNHRQMLAQYCCVFCICRILAGLTRQPFETPCFLPLPRKQALATSEANSLKLPRLTLSFLCFLRDTSRTATHFATRCLRENDIDRCCSGVGCTSPCFTITAYYQISNVSYRYW